MVEEEEKVTAITEEGAEANATTEANGQDLDDEEELGGQGLQAVQNLEGEEEEIAGQAPQATQNLGQLLDSETVNMKFQRPPPWPQPEVMKSSHSCRRTESGTSLSVVRLFTDRQPLYS